MSDLAPTGDRTIWQQAVAKLARGDIVRVRERAPEVWILPAPLKRNVPTVEALEAELRDLVREDPGKE